MKKPLIYLLSLFTFSAHASDTITADYEKTLSGSYAEFSEYTSSIALLSADGSIKKGTCSISLMKSLEKPKGYEDEDIKNYFKKYNERSRVFEKITNEFKKTLKEKIAYRKPSKTLLKEHVYGFLMFSDALLYIRIESLKNSNPNESKNQSINNRNYYKKIYLTDNCNKVLGYSLK